MKLYDFQQEDVDKLVEKRSAAIGSETGAGKTHEAIALDEIWNEESKKPTLVIAPLNTHTSWQEKYSDQAPATNVITIDRKNRRLLYNAARSGKGDVFLMHWDALHLMPELQDLSFKVTIADEIHRAANRDAKCTIALKSLKTEYKLGMSATMAGNSPDNLWSVYNWLWPKYYTSYWEFRRHYCEEEDIWSQRDQKYYKKITGIKNQDSLDEERNPWYVRHLKREACCPHHPNGVMPWLKDKTYDKIYVDLTPKQRKFYNQMRDNMVAWVGKHENEPLVASIAIARLTRLSQMALGTPELYTQTVNKLNPFYGWSFDKDNTWQHVDQKRVPIDEEKVRLILPSGKLEMLKDKVHDLGHKQIVVFSTSKQICYLAQKELTKSRITAEVLSGDTPQRDRDTMVSRFSRGDYQAFIGVIEAAAEGIDGLQHATDTAIFLDRSWSKRANYQAEGRLDRDGQKNSVNIIDIMARNTVDAGRNQKLELEWAWLRRILGDK